MRPNTAATSGVGLCGVLIAGISAAALTYVGGQQFGNGLDIGFNAPTFAAVAKVGTVGGAASMLQGGKFGHGFVSAGLGPVGGKAVGGALGGIIGNESVRRVVSSSIVGGTLSSMTGGKFANGARYAAFASIVSEGARSALERSGSSQSITPLATRQAAARKEVAALSTDGTLDTSRIFTGDSALDEAAIEVLDAVHPISEKYNVEIGGRLIANGNGVSYSSPVVGDATSVNISGSGALGGYHTHPGGAAHSVFSNRYNSASGGPGDAGWVQRNRIPLYMSNQVNNSINISVCSPGSARCRTGFVPISGVNRGISGTRVR